MDGGMKKIVIAGGSGFVGQALIREFKKEFEIVILGRSSKNLRHARSVVWDARNLGPWAEELEGAAAVINLTGEPIAQRLNDDVMARLLSSRVDSTVVLADALEKTQNPPPVWVNASAIGIYGETGDRETSEGGALGPAGHYLTRICKAWEEAVQIRSLPQTRRVILRIGLVLGPEGGLLEKMVKLARSGLGGRAGSGEQYMSWIHQSDLARMMRWAIENPVEGVFNGTAPSPVTNEVFMAEVRRAVRAIWSPPAPEAAIRLAMKVTGMDPELVLRSQRIVPARATGLGFQFEFPKLRAALEDLL